MNETFGTFLKRRFHKWNGDQLKNTDSLDSQKRFAYWLGVKPTTLSTWMTDEKTPTGSNVKLLADKLGFEVYDHLGVPYQTDKPKPKLLVRVWDYLPLELQDQWYEVAKRYDPEERQEQSGRSSAA